MNNRFAAGLSGIKQAGGKAAAQESTAHEAEVTTAVPPGAAPSRKGKVVISAYFDPAVRQQLAIMAARQGRSQAALMAEGLNLLFEKHGEPTIAKA